MTDSPPPSGRDLFYGRALIEFQRGADLDLNCRTSLCLDPQHGATLLLAALIAERAGRLDGALILATRAVAVDQQSSSYHFLRGLLLQRLGQESSAREVFTRVVCLSPAMAEAVFNLGALQPVGAASIACFRRTGQIDPSHFKSHICLARLYPEQGQVSSGLVAARKAVTLQPENGDARYYFGNALRDSGRGQEARRQFQIAVALAPGFAAALANLSELLRQQGVLTSAARCVSNAIAAEPTLALAHSNLGALFRSLGRIDDAFERTFIPLLLAPDRAETLVNLAILYHEIAMHDESAAMFRRARELDPANLQMGARSLVCSLYRSHHRTDQLTALARQWSDGLTIQKTAPRAVAEFAGRPRLGFISGDFRRHAVGFLTINALEALSRMGWEIYCYSNCPQEDEITLRFKRASRHWREIVTLQDSDVLSLIAADQIGILIDLAGLTSFNRWPILAAKAAPLQIAWVGYPASMGTDSIDYILADRLQIPVEASKFYVEKIIRLPVSYICFEPPFGAPPIKALPARRNDFVTFGSFNATQKLSVDLIQCWCQILVGLPHTRLVLKAPAFSSRRARERFIDLFCAHSIGRERLIFLGESSWKSHMAAMSDVDIALDSFPYSGGQTTLELLWMGIPVVTLAGDGIANRHSMGYLTTIGLSWLVAESRAAYVARAVELARDLTRLAEMRSTMRSRMESSELCDINGFARDFDTALLAVWQRYRQGLGPVDVDVTPITAA